jgi:hypothetical protein
MSVGCMTAVLAKDALRDCLTHGEIRPSSHFLDELSKEGLTLPDAWHVLKNGLVTNPPEHDVRTGEWKYRIEGKEPDGKAIGIVFCFKYINHVLLITVFSLEGGPNENRKMQ